MEQSISDKVIYEIVMQNHNKSNMCDKHQQLIIYLDTIYKKTLQNDLADTNEYESVCKFFVKYLDKIKIESFFIKVYSILKFLEIVN